MYEAVVMPLLW